MLKQIIAQKACDIVGDQNIKIDQGRTYIFPKDTQEISEIVKLANKERFKIVPVGSESFFKHKNLPKEEELILKLSRLSKVNEVAHRDLYASIQAGVKLNFLNDSLREYNLFYALALSQAEGTMGGVTARNLEAYNSEKRVKTKDLVMRLEVVVPTGEIIHTGAKTYKSVTGYDLNRLFIGSWGTLGIITEVTVKLYPLKEQKQFQNLIFDSTLPKNTSPTSPQWSLSQRVKNLLDPNQVFHDL